MGQKKDCVYVAYHCLKFYKAASILVGIFSQAFLLTEWVTAQDSIEQCSRYKQIVNVGQARFGWIGVLCANVALMLFCLPLSIAADYYMANIHEFVIRTIISLLCFLLMIEKFDILQLRDKHNFLKLLYVDYNFFASSYWSITCSFIVIFEHIVF